jgi:uncharacterized protein YkwD
MKSLLQFIRHLFTPHESNRFKSKLIHHDMLTVYLAFALALTFSITQIQAKGGSILGYATDISADKLFNLTNNEREKGGLNKLTYNVKLQEAAQKKAENMFTNSYWSHYGPNGETPWQFILSSGYQYEYAGENLAKNFLFSEGVVQAWMNSPTHRDNIMREEYNEVGFAVVNGVLNGEETTLVVQMFAKPLYASVTGNPQDAMPKKAMAPVENQSGDPVTASKTPFDKLTGSNQQSSFYSLFININVIFFIILIAALALDFYFAAKLNLIHFKGKNLIHIIFLSTLTAGIIFIINGTIL